MYRNCYFEYAGRYSGDYGLKLLYMHNDYKEFDSGGAYEPIIDSNNAQPESIMYSKNYSAKPLEFSIEFFHLEDNIPIEQSQEIKEWLFGQDGWKKFKLYSDGVEDKYLNCILIPESDITDVKGLRGFRCTLKNISPFWYGEEKTITIPLNVTVWNNSTTYNKGDRVKYDVSSKSYLYESLVDENTATPNQDSTKWRNISEISPYTSGFGGGNCTVYLDIDSQSPTKIYPQIEFKLDSTITDYYFQLHNYTGLFEESSDIRHIFDETYQGDILKIDCKYLTMKNVSENTFVPFANIASAYDSFYLVKGSNRITIKLWDNNNWKPEDDIGTSIFRSLQYIKFTYTPTYRLGAF